MKLKYYFLSLALATSCGFAFTSCDDDDDVVPVVVEDPDLTFDSDLVRVKIGAENKALVPIATGGGEYNAYSLDENIAKPVVEDGNLYVEGFKNGSTKIVVSDASNNYKTLDVSVYTTEEMTLSHTDYSFVITMGKTSTSNECSVVLGNGTYSVTSDNENVRATIDAETGEITLTAKAKKDEYSAVITVTDISGLTASMNVTVTATLEPFTQSEINALMALTEKKIDYNGNHSYYFDYYTDKTMKSVTANGYTETGWIKESYWYTYKHTLKYPEGTKVGEEVDGSLIQGDYSETAYNGKVKILADDATHFVGIYYNIDLDKEVINTGYVVWVK